MRAVLVIDLLEDYFRSEPLCDVRGDLVRNVNVLCQHARSQESPVIWVRQEFRDDLSDAFKVMRESGVRITIAGTPGCRILSELEREPGEREVVKKRYSAFFRTDLDSLLEKLAVRELVIAGINTHACIRMSVIDAYQRDLAVTIPAECVASYDLEYHNVSLRYLGGHIARVVSLKELVSESWLK